MMGFDIISWWKRDTARNTFVYANFVAGLVTTMFMNYIMYQMQATGFMIGKNKEGGPCKSYCLVPFGNQQLDLNAVILYINGITFAVGGGVTLFVIAYADFWKYKSLLLTFFTALYGAVAIPVYWLTAPTLANFNAISALYILWGVVMLILMVLLNVYIPYCMRAASEKSSTATTNYDSASDSTPDNMTSAKVRKYGFLMSILGMLANNIGAVIILGIIAIMAATMSEEQSNKAGVLMTTIVGFATLFGALGCYYGLPQLPVKESPGRGVWKSAFLELFTPFKQLIHKKNMALLLLAYTFYTDTYTATMSITNQLYFAEVKPAMVEFTLYTLAGNIFNVLATIVFYWSYARLKYSLDKTMFVGYAMILVVPLWGVIGIAPRINFGCKKRWEFYIQTLIINVSAAVVNPTFRLLYAELIPKGEEVMWYGLQIVISCATTWISYVATGPLQNATNNLRFPLVLCFVFLLAPPAIELLRLRIVKAEARARSDFGSVEEYDDIKLQGTTHKVRELNMSGGCC